MANLDDYLLASNVPGDPPDLDSAPTGEPKQRGGNFKVDAGLPASIDAETTVLGAILLDNAAFNEVAEILVLDDFSLESHQIIYRRMCELVDAGSAIDLVTLLHELQRHKEVEAVGGAAYLASLTEGLPRRPVIDNYLKIIRDKSMLRRIMAIGSMAIEAAADQSDPAIDILGRAEAQFLEVAQQAVSGRLKSVADSVAEKNGPDEYLKPVFNPELKPGLPYGFMDIDRMTGGMKKGELIIIAARPSVGKTAIAVNVATNVALDEGAIVAIFSLEMTRDALEKRMLASLGRVNIRRAMSGEYLSEGERYKIQDALARMVEAQLYIDETADLTIVQLRAKARRLKQKLGRLDLVVVDYLQLLKSGQKTESRRVEVEMCSRAMKAMAKELEVPVIALAQVGRSAEQRQDKRPMLSDLREAGGIEADADVVVFIHRPEMYDQENEDLKGIAEAIVSKQRDGATGVVKLGYIADCTLFTNLSKR